MRVNFFDKDYIPKDKDVVKNSPLKPGRKTARIGFEGIKDSNRHIALQNTKIYKNPPRLGCFEKLFKRTVILQVNQASDNEKIYVKVNAASLKKRLGLSSKELAPFINRGEATALVKEKVAALAPPKKNPPKEKPIKTETPEVTKTPPKPKDVSAPSNPQALSFLDEGKYTQSFNAYHTRLKNNPKEWKQVEEELKQSLLAKGLSQEQIKEFESLKTKNTVKDAIEEKIQSAIKETNPNFKDGKVPTEEIEKIRNKIINLFKNLEISKEDLEKIKDAAIKKLDRGELTQTILNTWLGFISEIETKTRKVGQVNISLVIIDDICEAKTEAIVNAANTALAAGAGVCGAIHRGGGDSPFEECASYLKEKKRAALKEGEAMITSQGSLSDPIKKIIHAVGPVWSASHADKKDKALYDAYFNSLELAHENKLTSIMFPSLSTGIFRFPIDRAAPIAMKAFNDFATKHADTSLKSIVLGVWAADYEAYAPQWEEKQAS